MSNQEKDQVREAPEQQEERLRGLCMKFGQLTPEAQIRLEGIAQGMLLAHKIEKSA